MCRWGCSTTSTTYQCKWCGTRFCRDCQRGDFTGEMLEPLRCRRCNQKRCQGLRVEYVPRAAQDDCDENGKDKGKGKDTDRSKSPAKKGKGSKKGEKKGGKKKGGKKKKKKK